LSKNNFGMLLYITAMPPKRQKRREKKLYSQWK
jgi:hypothetical protein